MGKQFLDQYSLLHFASGVVAYHFGLSAPVWLVGHVAFELGENSVVGMQFINKYLTIWPGGKKHSDTAINMFGDTVSAMVGWSLAWHVDEVGKKSGWY